MPDGVRLMAVGDIMLSENRGSGQAIKDHGPLFPFKKVQHVLQQSDILFGNLENPIAASGTPCPRQDPHITFRASPEVMETLTSAGFDVLSLANNHATDYGEDALLETLALLREQGVAPVGAGRNLAEATEPVFVEQRGVKIAFLAYSEFVMFATRAASRRRPGIAQFSVRQAARDVREARRRSDFVVVSMHWGLDYTDYPLPFQMGHARTLIDSGAGLILGHHPHHVQGVEHYHGGVIAYSLGDFVFDEPDQDTCILSCVISRDGLSDFQIRPARANEKCQPELTDPKRSDKITGDVERLSSAYAVYDPSVAEDMMDRFTYINLHIFLKSGNLCALKSFSSPALVARLLSYMARRGLNRLRFRGAAERAG